MGIFRDTHRQFYVYIWYSKYMISAYYENKDERSEIYRVFTSSLTARHNKKVELIFMMEQSTSLMTALKRFVFMKMCLLRR